MWIRTNAWVTGTRGEAVTVRAPLLPFALIVVASALGCGESDAVSGSSGSGSPPQSACPIVHATQACSCDGSPGRQACAETGWTACECVGVTPDGSAGNGGGSGGSSGGSVPSDHSGDPLGNARGDIGFDWERKAGAEGPCEPGVYAGTYSCEYVMVSGGAPLLVEGFVNITLARSASDGEVLVIEDGNLDGNAFLLIAFTATLSGSLTCSNDKFHADADNGMIIPVGGTFSGQLDGSLSRATQTLSGGWELTVDDGMGMAQGTCTGDWTAVLQP